MKMPDPNQLFRYSYIVIIGFLIGLFVGMNYVPSGRTNQYIASLKSDIKRQQQIINKVSQEEVQNQPTNVVNNSEKAQPGVSNVNLEKLSTTANVDSKTVSSNGLTINIPKNWKVEETYALNSGSSADLIITSQDLVERVRTETLIGDEQTVISGVKMYVYYQPENVAATIEDSVDYFNILVKYTSQNSKSRSVMIADIPMLLSRVSYSGNFSSDTANDEWALLQGRYAGKKIEIQIFYNGLYSDKQELLDGILASVKFVN